LAGHEATAKADKIEAAVKIDIKKLNALLWVDMSFKRTLSNFVHAKTIHFFHLDKDLCLQYIIPTVIDEQGGHVKGIEHKTVTKGHQYQSGKCQSNTKSC